MSANSHFVAAACISAAALAATADAADLVLVDNGRPKATIVIAKNAPTSNIKAAEELRLFVKKMSGAELSIVTDDNASIPSPRILIGINKITAPMNLGLPQKSSADEILERYIVRRSGDDLLLVGNDSLEEPRIGPQGETLEGWYKGSLFAVYDFLFEQGCRWYFPGDFGEVVPQKKTITVADGTDRTLSPAFLKHGYWMKPGFKDAAGGLNADTDHTLFFDRNRFISYDAIYSNPRDGSINTPFRCAKITPETNPAWFALNKDGIRANYPCMSNPDVVEFLANDALETFRKNPSVKSVGYAPPDGLPVCYCSDCARVNGELRVLSQWDCSQIPCVSGSYYKMIDAIAARVKKEFPDRLITASIYAGRIMPPPTYWKMNDNVAGSCAFIEYTLMHPIDDPDNWESSQIRSLLKSWKSRISKVSYRPYYPSFLVNLALPIPLYRNSVKDAKWLHANGIHGFVWEGWPSWGTDLLGCYLRSRFAWEPEADGERVIEEFYETFYGPAAAPLKKFYDALERAVVNAPFNTHECEILHEVYTWDLIKSLMPLIDEAEEIAAEKGEPLVTRVRMSRLQAEQLLAYSEMRCDAERKSDYSRAASLAGRMTELENEMLKICPAWIFPNHRSWDTERLAQDPLNGNFTSVGKRGQYKHLMKLTDGTYGRMITPMPRVWKLKTDTIQEGTAAQWYAPSTEISEWDDVQIARPLEMQGYFADRKRCLPFKGDAWFACDVTAEGDFDSDAVSLYIGGINNEAWIWVNGIAVGYQKFHAWWSRPDYSWICRIPKGVFKKGENRIVIRDVCGDIYGFGGIFRDIFLFEDYERDTVRLTPKKKIAQIKTAAVQMLPHGSVSSIEVNGDRLTAYTSWTRGFGILEYDVKDLDDIKLVGGALIPGFAEGRAKSKDGKYLYVATMYGLTILEKGKNGWTAKRSMTLNFSPSDHPAYMPLVDGDRLLLLAKDKKRNRLFDISNPDAPIPVKMDYLPVEGEFIEQAVQKPIVPEKIAAQCPQNKRLGGIITYIETADRIYALVRNRSHDVFVFDKTGRKIGELQFASNDGRMTVTDKAVYCATDCRLYWYDREKLGTKLIPDGSLDCDLPNPHGRIYNFLTAGIEALEGGKLAFDNAIIDISNPFAPKFVSAEGAPQTELQTGKPFLFMRTDGKEVYAVDTKNFYVLDSESGATNAQFEVDSPATLEMANGFVYIPAGISRSSYTLFVYDIAHDTMWRILGAIKDGVSASCLSPDAKRLFLSDGPVVRAFDLTNPLKPVEMANYVADPQAPPEPYADATQLRLFDGKLYLKKYSRINVWEVK